MLAGPGDHEEHSVTSSGALTLGGRRLKKNRGLFVGGREEGVSRGGTSVDDSLREHVHRHDDVPVTGHVLTSEETVSVLLGDVPLAGHRLALGVHGVSLGWCLAVSSYSTSDPARDQGFL